MGQTSVRPVGGWLGDSFGRLKENWLTLCGLCVFGVAIIAAGVAAVYLLGFAFLGFLQGWDNLKIALSNPTRIGYLIEESRGAFALFNLVAFLVGLRLYCWILKAAIHASIDPTTGFGEALRKGNDRGYAFLALIVVQQVLLNVGFMLLILPGIIMAVWFGFALWACARDESGVFGSLGDSARAVKGHFFGVFGRMLVVGLIGGSMMVVPVIGWLVGGAWMLVAWGCLYEDLTAPRPAPVVARPPRIPGRVAA
jgi:hypothetical protein